MVNGNLINSYPPQAIIPSAPAINKIGIAIIFSIMSINIRKISHISKYPFPYRQIFLVLVLFNLFDTKAKGPYGKLN